MRIAFDLTHAITRLGAPHPGGIDQVDMAYARHFFGEGGGDCVGVHYGLRAPHVFDAAAGAKIVATADARWREGQGDTGPLDLDALPRRAPKRNALARLARGHADSLALRFRSTPGASIPQGAVYLNVAQHLLEAPFLLSWLDRRPDLVKVFFIHDLLPLDAPEYFGAWNARFFERRIVTAFKHADAFIVASEMVRERLARELKARGAAPRPIHVEPLVSPLRVGAAEAAAINSSRPFFLVVGTIEPRKNHRLLLHAWRDLAAAMGAATPRLAIVGGRGWRTAQIAALLDRAPAMRAHVVELGSVSDARLAGLMKTCRALLMPSFEEGFGLPLVEALTLGAPVVASDIPVFREVAGEAAAFLSPIDGPGWRRAVTDLLSDDRAARERARLFTPRDWPAYFAGVAQFLATLAPKRAQ